MEFVSDRLYAPFLQVVEETLQADLPAPQKLEKIVASALQTGIQHKAIVKLVVQSDQDIPAESRVVREILEAFTAIFEQGIKEGSFHPHNPAHTGRMFLGAFHELFELLACSASEEAANEYVEVMIDAALAVDGDSVQAPSRETQDIERAK